MENWGSRQDPEIEALKRLVKIFKIILIVFLAGITIYYIKPHLHDIWYLTIGK
jgi:hypothetical protein